VPEILLGVTRVQRGFWGMFHVWNGIKVGWRSPPQKRDMANLPTTVKIDDVWR